MAIVHTSVARRRSGCGVLSVALGVTLLVASHTNAQTAPEAPKAPVMELPASNSVDSQAPRPDVGGQSDGLVVAEPSATPLDQGVTVDGAAPLLDSTEPPLQQDEVIAETDDQTLADDTTEITGDPVMDATSRALKFLHDGGPSIWAIAALSVVTVALILWKIWRLALIGAWSRGKARKAVETFERGETEQALALVKNRRGLRSIVVSAAIQSRTSMPEDAAREETSRVAKHQLGEAGIGLRALELIATIAPLLGLLGTVLGMIAAFQALQESGSRADPSQLAGGIWEALLTTAAGMAVAIPASAALTWFEAVLDRMRRDTEDGAMRVFVYQRNQDEAASVQQLAAE